MKRYHCLLGIVIVMLIGLCGELERSMADEPLEQLVEAGRQLESVAEDLGKQIEGAVKEAEKAAKEFEAGAKDGVDTAKNLTMKTFGGRQFWTDRYFFREWKIQKNVLTGHHRLLDGKDVRHASGSFETCLATLEEIKKKRKLEPMSGKAVILIHGLIRSSKSMARMRVPFEKDGYLVFGFDYASTQHSIVDAAGHLREAIASLDGVEEINFVVHSMGGLVVRTYLKDGADPRIQRMVMLGVPNQGAALADIAKDWQLFKTLFGPSGQELVTDGKGLIKNLPTPEFEFAIIAGSRGTAQGFNPLIPGDDDGTVSVESARLPGARDFMTSQCLHSFLMYRAENVAASVRFIETGKLRAEGERRPIPKAEELSTKP